MAALWYKGVSLQCLHLYAVLSCVLGSFLVLGRPLHLSELEFLYRKVKVLKWKVAEVPSNSK